MTTASVGIACPTIHSSSDERITLAHGEGGRLSRRLITEVIWPVINSDGQHLLGDAACLPQPAGPIAFTTDQFVVSPIFFPASDIGSLSVYGTINDLAVAGAAPLWMSLAFVLEEGLPMTVLARVLASIGRAAREVGVRVVTGDTKVVPKGMADGLFINTAAIGLLRPPVPAGSTTLSIGDELIISGPIARHGIAVLAAREQLGISPAPTSDCGSLLPGVEALRQHRVAVRAIRDATRGGVSAVLHEWARDCQLSLSIDEHRVPVADETRGVCELLGLDPLHVANEGTMVIAVEAGAGVEAVAALRELAQHREATLCGVVEARHLAPVVVQRGVGRAIPLDEPQGAPLPRIC
jgi:hydrogenase expression/formation protein HypE